MSTVHYIPYPIPPYLLLRHTILLGVFPYLSRRRLDIVTVNFGLLQQCLFVLDTNVLDTNVLDTNVVHTM